MQPVRGRIPELDGLRGIAIAMVMAFHAAVYLYVGWRPLANVFEFGWSGVDLFFVLSGFLIGRILIDERESQGYFKTFYARRIFRILPAYLAVVVCYGIVWVLGGAARHELAEAAGPPMAWWAYLTFSNNFFVAAYGTLFFLPVSWSLAVEEQFYLTLPLVVRLLPRRWLGPLVILVIVAVFCLRFAACELGWVTQDQAYVLPWFRADSLMVGVGCALVVRSDELCDFVRQRRSWLYGSIVVLGIAIWRVGWWLPAENGSPANGLMKWGLTLLALMYGGIVLAAVVACPGWVSGFLRWRTLRFLGGISYFVYLVHQALLISALYVVPKLSGWERWAALAGAYSVSILLGYFSWKYYESRMIAIGHRWKFSEREVPRIEIAA
jgi:peptidoglycan/LPS O-acetylase OafA/YrhL